MVWTLPTLGYYNMLHPHHYSKISDSQENNLLGTNNVACVAAASVTKEKSFMRLTLEKQKRIFPENNDNHDKQTAHH
jgi:hypothetical protein